MYVHVPAFFTGLTFALWGLSLTALLAVDNTVLGVIALVTAILWFIHAFHPLTYRRGA